ncbi:unnamed protein product [Didymodactylos carnosus]|uniref:Uncharacterized protein n=1 Tax=Didymodactylos carnosus TaxID=1234261 RepID=A0A813RJ40_9BILA|nr:unnamed protein product [Didymodactylos carnosus]CAF0834258.1 unnamed protein product [Didymodactylos carnosus]CAF3564974.1 unnamed protein product [Didymodactylos carnosus]CAF3618960.1 unnamed protein product [Didymodactylos carnosus]
MFASFPKFSFCRTFQQQQPQQACANNIKNEVYECSTDSKNNNSQNYVLPPTSINSHHTISDETKIVEQAKKSENKKALLSIKNVPGKTIHSVTVNGNMSKLAILTDNEQKLYPKNLSLFDETQATNRSSLNDRPTPVKINDERNLSSRSLSSIQNKWDEIHSNNRVSSSSAVNCLQEKAQSSSRLIPITHSTSYSNSNFSPNISDISSPSILANQLPKQTQVDNRIIVSTNNKPCSETATKNTAINNDIKTLNYAIDCHLEDSTYDFAEEFKSIIVHNGTKSYFRTEIRQSDNATAQDPQEPVEMNCEENDVYRIDEVELWNKTIWYISELRINRQPFCRSHWVNSQDKNQYHSIHQKLSSSVCDLKYSTESNLLNKQYATDNDGTIRQPVHSSLSLQNFDLLSSESAIIRQKSEDNIYCLRTDLQKHTTNNVLAALSIQEDDMERNNNLITNEVIKKKLLDILNDDELENACIEDLDYEFGKTALPTKYRSSSDEELSSDEALYDSANTDNNLKYNTISTSYDGGLSSSNSVLTKSRLHRTTSDKQHTEVTVSKKYLNKKITNMLSWYSSPLPHWRTDDLGSYNLDVNNNNALTSTPIIKHSTRKKSDSTTMIISSTDDSDEHINQVNVNDLLNWKTSSKLIQTVDYGMVGNKRKHRYRHYRRKEQYRAIPNQNIPPLHTSSSTLQSKNDTTICI